MRRISNLFLFIFRDYPSRPLWASIPDLSCSSLYFLTFNTMNVEELTILLRDKADRQLVRKAVKHFKKKEGILSPQMYDTIDYYVLALDIIANPKEYTYLTNQL